MCARAVQPFGVPLNVRGIFRIHRAPLKEIARALNHFCYKDTHTHTTNIVWLGIEKEIGNGETVTKNNLLFVPGAQSYAIIIILPKH